jgi:hypothetical protein
MIATFFKHLCFDNPNLWLPKNLKIKKKKNNPKRETLLSNEENIGKCSIISTCLVMGGSSLHIYLAM